MAGPDSRRSKKSQIETGIDRNFLQDGMTMLFSSRS